MPDLRNTLDGADPQDSAEVLDETMQDEREGGGEMRTLEELPDTFDVTAAEGDRDEDEALALRADEFHEDAFGEADTEEDDELDYRAATGEREDDVDGLGPEDGYDEDRLSRGGIDGLDEVADAESVEGGEDDFTNFQAADVGDDDLKRMGYLRGKPDGKA